MPEDPDDRGPQHSGEVPPQPNEPAWKKRKSGDPTPEQKDDRGKQQGPVKKPNADKDNTPQ